MPFKISEIAPDRWRHVDEIFHAAVDLSPAQRAELIDSACSEDPTLRNQIEALLNSDEAGWHFLEEPAMELAAPFVSDDQPQFVAGQKIGDYTILELIGRGGMGEVFLAKDPGLNRQVAIKFLPVDYTRDENRLRRFQNEAQAASALNHPNILTIYQLGNYEGLQFIVTEFVDGETVRELINHGPREFPQIIDVAIQITSALAAAHKAGIVHRDIKPENLMVRPDGYVKVLDFGLAKLAEQPDLAIEANKSDNPNLSSAILMGTVRYMSPEQARGLRLDARSDIYSLGAVLYEMIAGRTPFEHKDVPKLIDAIVKDEPTPLEHYRKNIPAGLIAIVNNALKKDCDERYQSAEDLLNQLKTLRADLERSLSPKKESIVRPVTFEQSQRAESTGDVRNNATTEGKRFVDLIQHRKAFVGVTLALLLSTTVAGFLLYKRVARGAAGPSSSAQKYVFTGKWTNRGSLSVPRRDTALAVLDNTLYVAGGWNTCTPYANLESYDLANDRWFNRAPMHVARGGHGLAVLNGRLYAVGGRVDCGKRTASVEAYDPRTDQWSERASLPSPREAHVVAAVNGKLYAIGGLTSEDALTSNSEYDPATDKWIDRAPLPAPRTTAAVVVYNNLIYVIGGGPQPEDMRSLVVYDPVADRWSTKAPMPQGRSQFGAALFDKRIYVFGGIGNNGQVDAYDPVNDSWSSGSSMPLVRVGFGAATFNGSIYFAGGLSESSHLSSVMTFMPCSDSGGTWVTKAPMPTARKSAATGVINGIVYVAGGYSDPWIFQTVNEAYDPRLNTWSTRAPMLTGRDTSGTNGAVVEGKMYVIGGNARAVGDNAGGFGFCTDANEAYDPVTDTWARRAPMPTARCHVAAVALNGLIYVVGGANTSGSERYATVEVYNPTTNSWTTAPPMPTARDHAIAGVIDGILYVAGGWKFTGPVNTLEAFDPKTNQWTSRAPMTTPLSQHAGAVVNGSLFVVGGESNLKLVSTIDVYDPATNSWATLSSLLPGPRRNPAIVALNDSLFILGGQMVSPSPAIAGTNEQFISPACLTVGAGNGAVRR